jgi:hypothetical protein
MKVPALFSRPAEFFAKSIIGLTLGAVVALMFALDCLRAAATRIGAFVLPSSFAQLVALVLKRRDFTRREKIRCWSLLRRARKGTPLAEAEWNELLEFAKRGLLHTADEQHPYAVLPAAEHGQRVWHPRFVAW